jgi:ATP-dependent Lon protease
MMIKNLYEEYKRDFKKFQKHKDEIKAFEKVDKAENSILNMEYDIIQLPTSNENKMAVYRKYKEMREKSEDERDEEYYKLKQWLQWALRIPYDRTKEFPVLRTDIARCLARVMDFPFEQISFGGIRTTEHLKGFDYTYVGSQPGEIVKCLSRMKYKNGILFLDEYEKVSDNNDINAFLLHLTDFSQNSSFRDNYLCDVSIDLSCLWLIYSMNQLPEDKALRDRIFTIKVSGYSLQDKIHIVRNFIFPVHIRAQSIPDDSIQIDSETASYLIQAVGGTEKGIRSLEQAVKDLVFKITFLVTHGESLQVGFKYSKVLEYPVTITRDLIDVLRKKNTSAHETSYLSMYS